MNGGSVCVCVCVCVTASSYSCEIPQGDFLKRESAMTCRIKSLLSIANSAIVEYAPTRYLRASTRLVARCNGCAHPSGMPALRKPSIARSRPAR